jgi:type III pantothenate kinase
MNIAIDIGNTRTKLAIFENQRIKKICTDNFDAVFSYLKTIPVSSGIISNVSNPDLTKKLISTYPKLVAMNRQLLFPIEIKYNSYSSLGLDRIANSVGAYSILPNQNNLIIDIGTCITYDFINYKNHYLGGSISPGFSIRFKALNNYTESLPNVKLELKEPKLIGTDTVKSIESGVINGVKAEIIEIVKNYTDLHPKTNVILTGGDSAFIKSIVSIKKNSIFAHENLTLIGLNCILNYNAKNN